MFVSCIAGITSSSGETSISLEHFSFQFIGWPLTGLYRVDLIVLGASSKLGFLVFECPDTIKSCTTFPGMVAPLGTCQVCGCDVLAMSTGMAFSPCNLYFANW